MYHFLCALNFHRLEEHPQSLIILSFLFVIYVSYILDNMKNPCKFVQVLSIRHFRFSDATVLGLVWSWFWFIDFGFLLRLPLPVWQGVELVMTEWGIFHSQPVALQRFDFQHCPVPFSPLVLNLPTTWEELVGNRIREPSMSCCLEVWKAEKKNVIKAKWKTFIILIPLLPSSC